LYVVFSRAVQAVRFAKDLAVGVAKVDTLFGVPDTELQRATQAQLKAVLDDVRSDTPYYAAYNPKPDDEAEFLKHGIDLQVTCGAHATAPSRASCTLMRSPLSRRHRGLDVAGVERDHRLPHQSLSDAVLTYEPCFIGAQARVEGYFSAARVGNAAIAEDLQGKLVAHLQAQLPELYERFTDKLDALNAELSTSSRSCSATAGWSRATSSAAQTRTRWRPASGCSR
jgi:hypothetical protein